MEKCYKKNRQKKLANKFFLAIMFLRPIQSMPAKIWWVPAGLGGDRERTNKQYISQNSNLYIDWSNEKGLSSTTKIVQRNNSERSNTTSQCIWIQIFLFVIVIVLPISQQQNQLLLTA
jgi:hypothetical protein